MVRFSMFHFILLLIKLFLSLFSGSKGIIIQNIILHKENEILKRRLKKGVEYYNKTRPHQGIEQRIPKGYEVRKDSKIKSRQILFGLNEEYYREAA